MAINVQGGPTMITNGDLLESWLSAGQDEKVLATVNRLKSLLRLEDCSDEIEKELMHVANYYCMRLRMKWQAANRIRAHFVKRNEEWLSCQFQLSDKLKHQLALEKLAEPGPSRGRPSKSFEECSMKTKKRRLSNLVADYTTAELRFAADESARLSGASHTSEQSLSNAQTLALSLDLNLSDRKYQLLRNVVNSLHPECFPSLYKLRQYRSELIPSDTSSTEISAQVNLQSLLNKTTESIFHTIDDAALADNIPSLLSLQCKWGFDGSAGHSRYKQQFTDPDNTDEFLFVIAFVPLKLVSVETGYILWRNARPSSTHFCRPIKFIFTKENPEVVMREKNEICNQIENLEEFRLTHREHAFQIKYTMHLTMLDGSAIKTLCDSSAAQNCYICGATPSQMNQQLTVNKPNIDHYKYGCSSLHAWIRSFECMLHISYRLSLKKWQVRGQENKQIFANEKNRIQAEFKTRMGLLVDVPKQGYGTTNDGNTARRFFRNPDLSSEITGIEKDLIIKLGLILRVISSGQPIKIDKLDKLLEETRVLYLKHYSWYYMPSTLHKILFHGKDIISHFELHLWTLSEEALEARHKEARKYRLEHTRKSSRIKSNHDLLNRLLLTSDPYISSLRTCTTQRPTDIDELAKEFLVISEDAEPSYPMNLPDLSSDSEESSEDE